MSVDAGTAPRRRSWLAFLPLVAFLALAAIFYVALHGGDHSRLPSALIGKTAPAFSLPGLAADQPGLSDGDLRMGKVTLINVFASWCVPCRDEHPALLALARDERLRGLGATLVGLAYKDDPAQSRKFLGDLGDPYARIGADVSGRVGIDWGVYGVPETFVVRGDGVIAYKFIGPLSPATVASDLLPNVEKAARTPSG
jgi:cytochrome c biogenesis protein CcmG, thiol:disulfide interchange protein DsbE